MNDCKILSAECVIREHGLTWCPIYKSASSMWMRNFVALSGFSTTVSLHSQHNSSLDYSSIVKQKFKHDDDDDEKKLQVRNYTVF